MASDTTQNSDLAIQIRPDDLMGELGIKKDAYYGDVKFLGIKLNKDRDGKVYLEEEQANLIRSLRSYMSKNDGKREGFQLIDGAGAIATMGNGAVMDAASAPQPEEPCAGFDEESLFKEASEVAGSRMTMGERLVLQLAQQMSYEDLHPETKAKVDAVRQATNPKFQPEAIAAQLLDKWRSQRSQQEVAA